MACTMPGFPDKYLPLMDTGPKGKAIAAASRFAYGPLLKQLRDQSMKRRYDDRARVAPAGRRAGERLRAALVAGP